MLKLREESNGYRLAVIGYGKSLYKGYCVLFARESADE